jgi:predicted porin
VGNSSKTYDAGLSIPVTATGSVLAEAAKTFTSTPAGKEAARLTASVGYDYFLSKRTDLYAIYVRDRNADFGSAGSVAFGMRHTF